MCLIIFAKQGTPIPFKYFRRAFVRNPHGAGFMVAKDGELIIKKGFFNLGDLWNAYKEYDGKYTCFVHTRWSTHGAQNVQNCHPWLIDGNHGMVHNGVLQNYTHFKNGLSDSGNFTNLILRPMFHDYPTLWKEPYFTETLAHSIGWSKIGILSGDGDYMIYNENSGEWVDGLWFSNSDYKPLPKKRLKKTFSKIDDKTVSKVAVV